ncbi:hypothetical protein A6V39_01735 [Candidatus Mycoplasma haematobovis]|uniref:Uncharacterized protein n=1 Tax=Candidatus Mycoplasma haematobovis TaxID=432608 RepID=A0A1A9QF49_9MOLU|nr:hypothetical protein [Candidatus Mycoplasma haematobovis]OAL10764.1 hypothetical protein A6V39_01735 [Candidatus Mycoplasma haematobovis]
MFSDLLKKSEELIAWWKIELGITIMSLSILLFIFGISTNWEIPSLESLDSEKINEHAPLFAATGIILVLLIGLIIISVIKSFRALSSFNHLFERISEGKSKYILKKSKILLTSIICLTTFPLIVIAPEISSVLALGIMVCKFLFYKNNKEIYNLANDATKRRVP